MASQGIVYILWLLAIGYDGHNQHIPIDGLYYESKQSCVQAIARLADTLKTMYPDPASNVKELRLYCEAKDSK